jgi:hypothetical protein
MDQNQDKILYRHILTLYLSYFKRTEYLCSSSDQLSIYVHYIGNCFILGFFQHYRLDMDYRITVVSIITGMAWCHCTNGTST